MRSPFDACLMMLPAVTMLILAGPAPPAAADLVIQVDFAAQEYFLSGTATGTPGLGGIPSISWDNHETIASDFENLLSPAAFLISGNTVIGPWSGFIHATGNVNGLIIFGSQNVTTLTGIETVRFDYSGWSAAVASQLESKALAGELLPTTEGDAAFNMTFAVAQTAVPEPSSLALSALGGLGFVSSRRWRKKRTCRTEPPRTSVPSAATMNSF